MIINQQGSAFPSRCSVISSPSHMQRHQHHKFRPRGHVCPFTLVAPIYTTNIEAINWQTCIWKLKFSGKETWSCDATLAPSRCQDTKTRDTILAYISANGSPHPSNVHQKIHPNWCPGQLSVRGVGTQSRLSSKAQILILHKPILSCCLVLSDIIYPALTL